MRVALFTPFSPDWGGGSVLIKSFLSELSCLDVTWYYLADEPARSVCGIWLGPCLSSTSLVRDLFTRIGVPVCSRTEVKALAGAMDADSYWIVAHNEGVCVASELQALGKRVHLTVHDDPVALFARSRRYWPLQPVMAKVFSRVLQASSSIDVVSSRMRDRYRDLHGIDSFAQFRYVPALPRTSFSPSPDILRIGHIGSLYHPISFRRFVQSCNAYAMKENKDVRIVRIGESPEIDRIAADYPEMFENAGELSEEQAISRLGACDFVYAMYPSVRRFKLFRQTSFPAKLATYIQAQRPIFAHTPMDSTLASTVASYRIGEVCASNKVSDIQHSIRKILTFSVSLDSFETFRADLLGSIPLHNLKLALGAAR